MDSIATRLAKLRLEKKESFQQTADAVGVSKAHIWELERGKTDNPSMKLIERLADHFGVSVSYMIGEDPEAKDADSTLKTMFREAKQLSSGDLEHIKALMKSMNSLRKK